MKAPLQTLIVMLALGTFACEGRAELEEENAALRERVTTLESQNQQLRDKVAELNQSLPRMEALTAERRGLEEQLQWLERTLARDAGPRPDGG